MIATCLNLVADVNLTQTAFALTPGYYLWSDLVTTHKAIPVGKVGTNDRRGYDGAEITPFGTGDENATFDFKVWRVIRDNGDTTLVPETMCLVEQLLAGTCTLGTATGADGGKVGASGLFADTIASVVKSALLSARENVGLSWGIVSPADNTIAKIIAADLCDATALIFEVDLGTATGANFLYHFWRRGENA